MLNSNNKTIWENPYTPLPVEDRQMEPQKDQPCMFDEVTKDPNYKGTPLMLYCPCPKCSPWC